MELSENLLDEVSLAALAADAARMLCAGQFDALATAYGYALAYGREISRTIAEDLSACLNELDALGLAQSELPPVAEVKYFKPGDHELFAVAACRLPATASGYVLLELVVASCGMRKYVYLEQLSAEPDLADAG